MLLSVTIKDSCYTSENVVMKFSSEKRDIQFK